MEYPSSSSDELRPQDFSSGSKGGGGSDDQEVAAGGDVDGEGATEAGRRQEEESGRTSATLIFRDHAAAFGVPAYDALELWAMETMVSRLDAEMAALTSSDLLRVNAKSLTGTPF